MIIIAWVGAAIAGGAALAGTAGSAFANSKLNKRAERFNKWMWEQQGERELNYWHMQNEYNLPANQMQRIQDAGLNPHLFYGTGSQANVAPSLSPKSAPSAPSYRPTNIDLGSVVQQYMSTKAVEAQIDRTQAETDRIKTQTEQGQFDLRVTKSVGLDTLSQALNARTQASTAQARKEMMEFDGFVRAVTDYSSPIDANLAISTGDFNAASNNLLQKAQRAGLQKVITDLENLKKTGVLRDDQHTLNQIEKEIRDFRGKLANMGISPESAQGLQVVVSILKSIFGR